MQEQEQAQEQGRAWCVGMHSMQHLFAHTIPQSATRWVGGTTAPQARGQGQQQACLTSDTRLLSSYRYRPERDRRLVSSTIHLTSAKPRQDRQDRHRLSIIDIF